MTRKEKKSSPYVLDTVGARELTKEMCYVTSVPVPKALPCNSKNYFHFSQLLLMLLRLKFPGLTRAISVTFSPLRVCSGKAIESKSHCRNKSAKLSLEFPHT
jgi:hypothetical protein